MKSFFLSIFLILSITGCHDDGGTTPSQNNPSLNDTNKRYLFLPGFVKALPYVCGENKGITGKYGEFYIAENTNCDFKIGPNNINVPYSILNRKIYVSLFDIYKDKQIARNAMAVIKAISFSSKESNTIFIIDDMIEHRVPKLDFSDIVDIRNKFLGKFKGSVTILSDTHIESLFNYYYDSNHNLKKDFLKYLADISSKDNSLFTQHHNYVNFKVYDYNGNPLTISSASSFGNSNLWIKAEENPNNNKPEIGLDKGEITGKNIFGILLQVGRNTGSGVASAFKDYLFSAGSFKSPISIYSDSSAADEENNSYYPKSLNFGFSENFVITAANVTYRCAGLQIGQGSEKASWGKILNFTKNLAESIYESSKMVVEEGESTPQDVKTVKSYMETIDSALDLRYENWWIVGQDASKESYRTSVWKNRPALLTQCTYTDANGDLSVVPATIFDSTNDHTFSMQLGAPGQKFLLKQVK